MATCGRPAGAAPCAVALSGAPSGGAGCIPLTVLGRRLSVPARVMLLLVPGIWGSYVVMVRVLYLLPWGLAPEVFNKARLVLASRMVLPGMGRAWGLAARARGLWLRGDGELGAWVLATDVAQVLALRRIGMSRVGFLTQLSTVILPTVVWALSGRRPGWRIWLAATLAVACVGPLGLGKRGI